jgi:ATPase subunit of ABC transporter with duplicated ATPase domains
MSEVAPGWKLRVLLTQALFANPDILLLDEPTNNLDINTIRWLEDVLNERNSTMIIISHDRHFLNQVCTHMADLDYGKITVYPGNYDDFMEASTQARERSERQRQGQGTIAELQAFVRRFSANKSKAKQATSRLKLIDKLKPEDVKPSSRQYPWIRFDYDEKDKLHRQAVEIENVSFAYEGMASEDLQQLDHIDAGDRSRSSARTASARPPAQAADGRTAAAVRQHQVGGEGQAGYYAQDHSATSPSDVSLTDWISELSRAPTPPTGDDCRNADPRHARPPAVLRRRSEEVGQGDLRRRAGPHAVRQADADAPQRAADGRADQPPRHGIDRVAQHRAGEVQAARWSSSRTTASS